MVEDHSDSERGREEGNVLFNEALNTFLFMVIWRRTYMVEDHSDSERGRGEGNVLFNNTLNTFLFMVIWCRIYGRGLLR